MSEDETIVLIISMIVAGLSWLVYTLHVARRTSAPAWGNLSASQVTLPLVAAPLLAFLLILIVLTTWASHDVRDSGTYLFFYAVFTAAWVGAARWLIGLFGVSYLDDALERRNRAAAYAVAGAILGIACSFAGGNIGDGPGWWVVVYCGLLSTGGLFLLWGLLEWVTDISETITVERDAACGLRFLGWSWATGILLGASVAGDWTTLTRANLDFLQRAWPALILWAAAAGIEIFTRPNVQQPVRSVLAYGAAPALLYLGVALLWTFSMGLNP